MKDPLSAFLHEKVAAEVPSTAESVRPFTKDPDPESHDPGERAFAALMASSGGALVSKIVPMLGNMGLRTLASHDDVSYPRSLMPANSVRTIDEAFDVAAPPKSKLMGLWDVTSRRSEARGPFVPLELTGGQRVSKNDALAAIKLQEIQGVVDSFINKHDLTRKGVRLNMHQGPLSFVSGNRYDHLTKQVFLPDISKEQVLHELGHAADSTGSRLGKIRNLAAPVIQRGVTVALPLALIAGDAIKEKIPGTIDDRAISFMQDHAPEIMGATLAATQLYPEAKASYLAYKHIAQTEGREAARAALKKFIPMWGTYLLGAVPAVVGMALARKYMRQAREEREGNDSVKVAGLLGEVAGYAKNIGHGALEAGKDVLHVGKAVGQQTLSMLKEPGLASRVGRAAKEVGASPEFVYGALSTAMPAALGSLYLYGTESGKMLRERIDPDHHDTFATVQGRAPVALKASEEWREQHPARFAGLVAAGAALSGGIIAKFLSDLQRVL